MREQTQNTKTRLSFRFCDAFCFDSFSSGLCVIYYMIFFFHQIETHCSLVYMQHSISIFNLYIWSFFYFGDLYYFLAFNNFSSFYFQISLCKLTKRYNSFSMPAAHSYYACVFGCPRRMAFFLCCISFCPFIRASAKLPGNTSRSIATCYSDDTWKGSLLKGEFSSK